KQFLTSVDLLRKTHSCLSFLCAVGKVQELQCSYLSSSFNKFAKRTPATATLSLASFFAPALKTPATPTNTATCGAPKMYVPEPTSVPAVDLFDGEFTESPPILFLLVFVPSAPLAPELEFSAG